MAQVGRDLELSWTGPGMDLELSGRVEAHWRLGDEPRASALVDGIDFCRRLSGREPDTEPRLLSGEPRCLNRVRVAGVLL